MSLCYRVAFNERVTTLKQQKRSGREREKLKQKDNLRSSEKKNSRNEYFKRSCKRRTEKKTREKNNEKNKKKKWKIKRAIVSQYFTHACTISSCCWLTKFNVVFFYSLLHFGFSQIWKMNEAAYEANEWISKIHRIWWRSQWRNICMKFSVELKQNARSLCGMVKWECFCWFVSFAVLFECENDVQCVTYSAAIQH